MYFFLICLIVILAELAMKDSDNLNMRMKLAQLSLAAKDSAAAFWQSMLISWLPMLLVFLALPLASLLFW